jgi:hypothetical protein
VPWLHHFGTQILVPVSLQAWVLWGRVFALVPVVLVPVDDSYRYVYEKNYVMHVSATNFAYVNVKNFEYVKHPQWIENPLGSELVFWSVTDVHAAVRHLLRLEVCELGLHPVHAVGSGPCRNWVVCWFP